MVSLDAAKLTGVVMTVGIFAIAGTNLAYAQQAPCGEQAYVYNVGCIPVDEAHMIGVVLVAGIIALAVACGIVGRNYQLIHKFK